MLSRKLKWTDAFLLIDEQFGVDSSGMTNILNNFTDIFFFHRRILQSVMLQSLLQVWQHNAFALSTILYTDTSVLEARITDVLEI